MFKFIGCVIYRNIWPMKIVEYLRKWSNYFFAEGVYYVGNKSLTKDAGEKRAPQDKWTTNGKQKSR